MPVNIESNYRGAWIRNVTAVDQALRQVGIGFELGAVPGEEVVRLRLSIPDARALANVILERVELRDGSAVSATPRDPSET